MSASRRRRRSPLGTAGSLTLCLSLGSPGCGAAPRPSDAEIHRLAAEALRAELSAPSPILLHPLLMRAGEAGSPGLARATFDVFDSSAVPAVIALGSPVLGLCATTAAGSCEVPPGSVAVVLSHVQDLRQNGIGVAALVIDGREGRPARQRFIVRVNARAGDWEVVEVRGVT